ncbi:MAG: hypothetical protein R2708_27910 [Vicinamibacterales bacterium]
MATTSTAAATLWLSCHVDYACRHSGACCRAGWPLPVERGAAAAIAGAVASRRLTTVDGDVIWLRETAEAPEGMAGTFRLVDGACAFHVPRGPRPGSAAGGRHCAVHATLGQQALPASCQHFPRICLIDARGVRVSLSMACPTAAALVVDETRPVAIVAGPRALPGVAVPEGLDARDQLPPRLSRRVLMDLDGLSAWEAHVVAALAGPAAVATAPEVVLSGLAAQAAALSRWMPGRAPLAEAITALGLPPTAGAASLPTAGASSLPPTAGAASPSTAGCAAPSAAWPLDAAQALLRVACPPEWRWTPLPDDLAAADAAWVAPRWHGVAPAVRRYLAARAFGAWMAYQADAAEGLISWLHLALTVLRAECGRACAAARSPLDRDRLIAALGCTDRLLLHYADGLRLAGGLLTRAGA